VHKALENRFGVGAPRTVYLPRSTVQVSGDTAEKVLRLVENLEENDDVQHVHANFEISDEEMAAIESRVQ
jgi:transcriptional/translational regulatory protein YebC/TACO1